MIDKLGSGAGGGREQIIQTSAAATVAVIYGQKICSVIGGFAAQIGRGQGGQQHRPRPRTV